MHKKPKTPRINQVSPRERRNKTEKPKVSTLIAFCLDSVGLWSLVSGL